jgi:hypothetical protein
MAFIKKFRNGKPVDMTVPQMESETPQIPQVSTQSQPQQNPIPIPIPTPQQQQSTSSPKATPKQPIKRGGCGCGRK